MAGQLVDSRTLRSCRHVSNSPLACRGWSGGDCGVDINLRDYDRSTVKGALPPTPDGGESAQVTTDRGNNQLGTFIVSPGSQEAAPRAMGRGWWALLPLTN